MAKKTGEIASANVRTGTDPVFEVADSELAQWLGIDLSTSANVRIERAVVAYNMATRNMVEAGVQLASVKAEISHEAFIALIEERGLGKERAYELIRGAAFAARLPAEQREQVLALPKTKVLALSSASKAVVAVMLEDGDIDIDLIGVRKLRQRIRELEAELTDTSVQLETTQIKADELKQALERGPRLRDDGLPVAIADARQEVLAHCDIARIAIDNLDGVVAQLDELPNLNDPRNALLLNGTKRLALAGLCALAAQVRTLIENVVEQLDDDAGEGRDAMRLTEQERHDLAQQYHQEVAIQGNDKVQRAKTREAKRQSGRGRPIKVEPTVRGKR